MNFLETAQFINNGDFIKVENELNIHFPKTFVTHYLKYNGGYPEKDEYVWKNGEATYINVFFSLKYEGFCNLEETYKNLCLLENYLPIGILPFATDDGGNFFCISLRQEDYGQIFYFNNDQYDNQTPESALTQLEDSFEEFLQKLS